MWKIGTMIRRSDELSYEAQTDDGNIVLRNRVHFKVTNEIPMLNKSTVSQ